MSQEWIQLIEKFEIRLSAEGKIDSKLLSRDIQNVINEFKKFIPEGRSIQLTSGSSNLTAVFLPLFKVLMLSHGVFKLLKKKSSTYGQTDKHAIVDLWSEDIALRSLIQDTFAAIKTSKNSSETYLRADALLRSGEALLASLNSTVLRFLSLEPLAPLFDECRSELIKSYDLLGRVKFSKETTLPF